MYINPVNVGRITFAIFLALLYYYLVSQTLSAPLTSNWTYILDDFHLIMHEAGHFLLMPLSSHPGSIGQFIYILGGSLLQWLLPIIFTLYFVFQKNIFAAFVTLFWLGHSLLNSVPYIADAKNMLLPLLGGDSSIHDWNYILSTLGMLEYTKTLALSVYILALVILTVSLIGASLSALWPIIYPSKEDVLYRNVFK